MTTANEHSDPMTFICELDLYSLEIYRMCKYELCMSMLLKVYSVYILTDRQVTRDLVT